MVEWYWLPALATVLIVLAAVSRGWTRSRALYDALTDPDKLPRPQLQPRGVGVMPQSSAVTERPPAPGRRML